MKKFLFLFTLLSLAFISMSFTLKAHADDIEIYDHLKTFETRSGDSLSLDRSRDTSYYKYRANMNDSKALDIDLRGYNWGNLLFTESNKYYLFYGSMLKSPDDFRSQVPFIIRLEKDLSKYIVYFNDSVENFGYMTSLIEYPTNNFIAIENISGDYYFGTYSGKYELFSFDEDLTVKSSIYVTSKECRVNVAVDTIEVETDEGDKYYFDDEFNLISDFSLEKNAVGSFTIYKDSYVNDKYQTAGTSFNTPGNYTIRDDKYTYTIHLKEKVMGVENGHKYKEYVEYKSTGGTIYLNGDTVYLNGLISEVGEYTLKVTGLNGYESIYNFEIEPTLITEITDGSTLSIGDTLKFTGYIRINDGDYITDLYEIKTSGTYKLSLYKDKTSEPLETIYFNVPELTVTKRDMTWAYIILSVAIAGTALASVIIALSYKRKKKVVNEDR